GNYLRWANARGQDWDAITAALLLLSTVASVGLAEPMARALRALLDAQQRERLLTSIFANLPANSVLALAKGESLRYLEFSNTFGRLYGLFPRQGDSHYELFPGLAEAVPLWADQVRQVIWSGQAVVEDEPVAYLRPDGGEGYATYTLNPIPDLSAERHDPPYLLLLIWRDVTTIHRLRQEVEKLVHRDDLTGLYNRRYFDARLQQMLSQQQRGSGPVTLILIDLDHFSVINGGYGHLGGNAVLIEVGNRLGLHVRGGDTPVRWAGDEFAVLCENTGAVAGLRAARRLHSALALKPMTYQGSEIYLRASIGVATHAPDSPESLDEFWRRADTALYRAKDQGRNRVAGEPEAEAYLALEERVVAAVERDEIMPYYQPIFDLTTGELVGAEALARWPLPDGGLAYPGDFLPVIEDSAALTFAFCESQLLQVCQQAVRWQDRMAWVSFNLSQRTLERVDLLPWLTGCFDRTGIDPDLIAIETTERLSAPDPGLLEKLLNVSFDDLLKSGMRLLLDDFGGSGGGTGIQLSWMVRALGGDANQGTQSRVLVKLDRRLIENLHCNEAQRRLTQGVINTIRGIGLQVIAEGVEMQGEADCLRELGCNYVQGWLYDKALPSAEFEAKYLKLP
ncbi:MAG: bifunctional diguanylate cyclase/phosphodiesterase, partial [Nodosilinea sp.]